MLSCPYSRFSGFDPESLPVKSFDGMPQTNDKGEKIRLERFATILHEGVICLRPGRSVTPVVTACLHAGVSMNPFELMIASEGDSFKYDEPDFPEGSMKKKERNPDDLTVGDAVAAVQSSFIQVVSQCALILTSNSYDHSFDNTSPLYFPFFIYYG